MFQDDARDIGKAILAAARNGDPTAMKIFADRAYPPSKGRTFKIDLPPEPAAAFAALQTAVSNREISAEEACAVGEFIEKKVRAIDMQEMMKRLEALEESQSSREGES